LIPGALVGVVIATTIATVYRLPIQYVDVPGSLLEAIQLPTPASFPRLIQASVLIDAMVIAFIASTESLLSAVAVDRLHTGPRTNFDRELTAQGIGNIICGFLGALPMTGVIARSSVNVEAGAKTRLSTMLHGLWLLILVIAAPSLLKIIPISSLAAILVFTGYKLIEVEHIRQLRNYGRFPLGIFFATLITIVVTDLITGVFIGILLTGILLIHKMSVLNIEIIKHENNRRIDIHLQGAATFIRLPKLANILELVPPEKELHVYLQDLAYIDHSCLDLLSMWAKQQEKMGSTLTMQWDRLIERNRKPYTL